MDQMKFGMVCTGKIVCVHAFVCLRGGLFKERQQCGVSQGLIKSMPHPLQPHIRLKSVPHCVWVNDPGGTPTPAARHTFPSTCLLCPGCGPVREDYTEECSQAHLLKQERRSKLRPRAESSCSLSFPQKFKCTELRGGKLWLSYRSIKLKKRSLGCISIYVSMSAFCLDRFIWSKKLNQGSRHTSLES